MCNKHDLWSINKVLLLLRKTGKKSQVLGFFPDAQIVLKLLTDYNDNM